MTPLPELPPALVYGAYRTVAVAQWPQEAAVMMACLEGSGIDACLQDEFLPQLYPVYADGLGRTKVCVHEDDWGRAVELLALPPVVGGSPACPRCGSSAMINRPTSALNAVLIGLWFIYVPLPTKNRVCLDCGARFKRDHSPLSPPTPESQALADEAQRMPPVVDTTMPFPLYMHFLFGMVAGPLIVLCGFPLIPERVLLSISTLSVCVLAVLTGAIAVLIKYTDAGYRTSQLAADMDGIRPKEPDADS